jgi:hypothetical protein
MEMVLETDYALFTACNDVVAARRSDGCGSTWSPRVFEDCRTFARFASNAGWDLLECEQANLCDATGVCRSLYDVASADVVCAEAAACGAPCDEWKHRWFAWLVSLAREPVVTALQECLHLPDCVTRLACIDSWNAEVSQGAWRD